ncbi:GNAT family N-acetyltransferase [Marinimicrobium sp. ABcell2]|uniref:GNAT family N-acetyltransferase n=1 Tax=Marinimicrobium sp. ABcell2 TaxID=3069751 RepID=UPI0027AF8F4C|nr:GNAT family N-acetyltransferase [Marinimicrobium sp. ABcell2]MDQ2076772.1 GNAT family N-acetyltransferase [Marinimicrobium sp. ABcell2]
MDIRVDDLQGAAVRALLAEHLRHMHEISPPESVHALDLDGLRQPGVTFWSAWERDTLLGCGALKELSPDHGEIKSMRTTAAALRKGVASALLSYFIQEAKRRGYQRLSLETGPLATFAPAHHLYQKFGFELCGPFASYCEDPHSVFMTLPLAEQRLDDIEECC